MTIPAVLGLACLAGCQSELAQGGKSIQVPVTARVTEEEMEFTGAGGVKLHGSLMVPAGSISIKRPAVLLVQGSGPTDRDGNQPGLAVDTLKQLAKGLAAADVVTFRFDKRACAKVAGQWPKDPA